MGLRIRFAYAPNSSLGYSIERLSDGLYYDFAGGTFTATPATPINTLTAGTGNYIGLYRDTIATTPVAQFSNGEYAINLHNTAASNQVIGVLSAQMYNGDGAPVFAAADPWSTSLPGSYAAGTAGSILGGNLDAKVSSRLATTGYTGPLNSAQVASAVWDELKSNHVTSGTFGSYLDAAVSTRSTYAGGAVASVTAPVTVGTNNDKAGYGLAQAFPANFGAL
ncbi:MAG TPA: hypothetical protein VG406_21985, partial [Isosphaeraceae bacterium]|nr:hypothetical protein [Isosphaeraceae bacterium]